MEKSTAPAEAYNHTFKTASYFKVWHIVHGKEDTASLLVDLYSPLEKRFYRYVKRAVDLVCSSFLLIFFFSWILPIMSLLIKLDSKGPVFFSQKRNKKDGGVFTCIKFRTMIVNAEADMVPATENDHRITRLGRFLRIHHLDELPQLLNVFWGDMTMVGPRPHMFAENRKYQKLFDFYSGRHRVKPGITGLAQVLGYVGSTADPEKMKQRVQLDLFYIRHWSPALDARIMLRSLLKILGL